MTPGHAGWRGAWRLLTVAAALIPVLGAFTTDRIFFVRDLAFFFWSRHLWLRHAVSGGRLPLWDPYVATGQSAIADALNQLLMPLTLAIRLLPSAVASFNLWIALPLPIAALGTYEFLRRRVNNQAAALGACVFALSGPVVSMLNTPNLSWSMAMLPWVLLASSAIHTGRAGRRVSLLAAAFALQALCGEPVTWVCTAIVAVACVPFDEGIPRAVAGDATSGTLRLLRRRARAMGLVVCGLAAGACLAAAQLLPTFVAGARAHRAALATPDFWSLHPLALWETLAPHLFGNYYDTFLADLPWISALNFGRDPFFFSLYIGPLVLLLVVIALATRPRRSVFWLAVGLAFLVAALGGYTPIYPFARRVVPALALFRFPVKYILLTMFACAVMTADGWAALMELSIDEGRTVARVASGIALAALAALIVAVGSFAAPGSVLRVAHRIAVSAHLKDAAAGAAFLARVGPPLAARGSALLLAGCALIAIVARGTARGRASMALLFACVCGDLLVSNSSLNPTMAIARLAPPAWYTAASGATRLYIGARVRGFMNTNDLDGTTTWQIPAERTAIEGRMALNADLPMAPSGWRVREALSYDLPVLWPAEYDATVRRFEQAGSEQRSAFLRRSGVRWCVMPVRPSPASDASARPWSVVADVSDWNMRVYECNPSATRVFLATSVTAARDPADLAWQRDALFDPSLDDGVARLARVTREAGRPGAPTGPYARIVDDGAERLTVEAGLRAPGTLVVRDSYDDSWTAQVDGLPAGVARANGRYRAIALPAGTHVIRFAYRPRELRDGLIMSGMSALVLLALSLAPVRPRRAASDTHAAERGFTLVELMIVLAIIAILMAVAFTAYRGMQARGNAASALGSLRSIAAAQWQFAMTCGNLKYASTLSGLAKPVPATGQAFLSPDLTAGDEVEKSGYTIQIVARPLDAPPACNGATVADGYAATADPVKPGSTGTDFYGVNADRVLYLDEKQTFTANLAESGAPTHGEEVK